MRHHPSSIAPAGPALVLALASALLAGCAEMHRGVEAVGRIGSSPAAAEEAGTVPSSRPDVKTVRPRGAPRAPASDTSLRDSGTAPAVVATAVPSPRQIFDFHPAGSRPDSWRQPFVIDAGDGPLAADVRRSSAELKAFMADRKAGDARAARTAAATPGAARSASAADGTPTGTARTVCGEMDAAAAKPGCAVPAGAPAPR